LLKKLLIRLEDIVMLTKIIDVIEIFYLSLTYRKRRVISFIIGLRFSGTVGHVFFGSNCIIKGHKNIYLKGRFVALERNRIEAICCHGKQIFSPKILIGNDVSMEYDCHIGSINRVEIGNHVLIASRVYISDHTHGEITNADLLVVPNKRLIVSKGPIIIEDEVWLGEGVIILPNVRIGRSAIIGANSVVTHNIPPYSVAVGSPAKVIKTLAPLHSQ
jgi:acetyltransferase-like isoleucine patch superfamily enzyme